MLELEGKILSILPEQKGQGKEKEWEKGGFVIKTEGKYPKTIAFTTWNENTKTKLTVGQNVKVAFDIESREYNNKWYTDVKVIKFLQIASVNSNTVVNTDTNTVGDYVPCQEPLIENEEELPF